MKRKSDYRRTKINAEGRKKAEENMRKQHD
jgi:hypothetical protein